MTDKARAQLAPTGVLRAGINLGSGIEELRIGIHFSHSRGKVGRSGDAGGIKEPFPKHSTLPYDGIIRIRL